MIVVADSGPLIHLSRIGHLSLLPQLFGTVHLPTEVFDEIVVAGSGLPGSRELEEADWAKVVDTAQPLELAYLISQLDRGEIAAIALAASRRGSTLLIDDLAGRRAAQELGLSLIGTVGIVLAAKHRGLIPLVGPILQHLSDGGFWLSSSLVQSVLNEAGEA